MGSIPATRRTLFSNYILNMLLHDSLINFIGASPASGGLHWLEFSQLLALSLVLTIPLLFGLRWLGAFLRFLAKWMLRIPAISYLLDFLCPVLCQCFFSFCHYHWHFLSFYDGLAIFFETLEFSQSICAATLLAYTYLFRFHLDYRRYLDQILQFKLIFFAGYTIFLIFSCQFTYLLLYFPESVGICSAVVPVPFLLFHSLRLVL